MNQTSDNSRPGFRARFTWGIDGSILWLKDQKGDHRSLTNDIENSLVELTPYLPEDSKLTDYHIIYRDSFGAWDAIVITKLAAIEQDFEQLQRRNQFGQQFLCPNLKVKFFPICLTNYGQAVTSIVSNLTYRHSNTAYNLTHKLN